MSKGLQLPVNTLIILIVAVIVLLAVAAMFMMGWFGIGEMTLEQALNNGCHKWLLGGCNEDPSTIWVDIDRDDEEDSGEYLKTIADNAGVTDLRTRCTCPSI